MGRPPSPRLEGLSLDPSLIHQADQSLADRRGRHPGEIDQIGDADRPMAAQEIDNRGIRHFNSCRHSTNLDFKKLNLLHNNGAEVFDKRLFEKHPQKPTQ